MLSQSSTIAFFLLAGFIVYVTMKKELPAYAAVLGIGTATGATAVPYQTSAAAQSMNMSNAELAAYEAAITE